MKSIACIPHPIPDFCLSDTIKRERTNADVTSNIADTNRMTSFVSLTVVDNVVRTVLMDQLTVIIQSIRNEDSIRNRIAFCSFSLK